MLKKLSLSLILVSFLSVVAQAQEARIYVARDGQPVATIVQPKDAPKWTSQAVAWLNEYVEKVSGTKLEVVTEDSAPEGTLIKRSC
jgi:hypothetical protein